MRWRAALALGLCLLPARAQLTVGTVEGSVLDARGRPAAARLDFEGSLGRALTVDTGPDGRYVAVLPYGPYLIHAVPLAASCRVNILPLTKARCDLRAGEDAAAAGSGVPLAGAWNAAQELLFQMPAVVTDPLNFAGLGAIRLPLVAGWPAAWTATTWHLHGLDATDPYQPGLPALVDDARAEAAIIYREAYAPSTARIDGVDANLFLRGADRDWHGGLTSENTGSAFAGDNLPAEPARGAVVRPEIFQWFTRDTAALSGPLARWADIAATGTAQWAYQTAPLRPDRTDIGSKLLFGNIRGRLRPGERDRVDALYSGSRLNLYSGGWPAGIGAILASPVVPSFYGVYGGQGFENLKETDHFDFVQAGWTHQFGGRAGLFELRYEYSTGHLDTSPLHAAAPVVIDLLDSAPADAPLTNLAIRTRHSFAGAWQSGEFRAAGVAHRLAATASWERAEPRNRFDGPASEQITAAGQPAFNVQLNIPADTRYRIRYFTLGGADSMRLAHGIAIDAALLLDAARGSVAGEADAISWNSPSPRIALAFPAPRFSRLTLRGNYSRTYTLLAGRYLDYADPQALTGLVFDPASGALLSRFGGAFSSVAAGLQRPYADQFRVGAELALPIEGTFSLNLLRRDLKHRIAAVNTGVPFSSYQPVAVRDPGPDFIFGTFDDQTLTVFAQNPATLGQDRYLLTNPAGLREQSEALIATVGTRYRSVAARASFAAVKSWGPTNPGNSAWENDPGIIGSLFSNPNTLINATGHTFMDRAFIGKFQAMAHAPARFGGFDVISLVNYLDGLPFARRLLVTGLSQGPFLVNTTVRGSPEGGNRAQYVLNWNLRIARTVGLPFGQVVLTADLLNVLNNGNKIVESDLSGPLFLARPALAFLPPRMLRLGFRWEF